MPLPRMERRFRWACLIGALAAAVVFSWVLFIGRAETAGVRAGSDFYDAQARALFDGHWDLPPDVLSIEAFNIDGRSFTYFGPVPALLRMPVLAVTDRLDGRLTQWSMLVAFGVALYGVSLLSWRIRTLGAPDREVTRADAVMAGAFVFALGTGSVVLYLASQAVVYHEAILWGTAFALLAYHSLIGYLVRTDRRSLVLASLFATLAFLTRASVGLGPVAVLGLAALVMGVGRLSRGAGGGRPPTWVRAFIPGLNRVPSNRKLGALVVALLVPVVLYAGVNVAKFETPFRLPLEKQVFSDVDENRQAALADNGGSLFGLKFVPTTLLQAVRPDVLELDRAAPWINFPRRSPTIVGGATFDTLDESSSATATMPLLVVLGLVGLVAVVRARVDHDDPRSLVALRLPVLGALVGFGTTLTIAFIAHRYLGDAVPALVLLALTGVYEVMRWLSSRSRLVVVAACLGGGALAAWGVAANVALAVEYQRLIAPADLDTRDEFVRFQHDAPGSRLSLDASGGSLDDGERGDVVILGDCDALLWSDGFDWYVLEGTSPEADAIDGGSTRPPVLCRKLQD